MEIENEGKQKELTDKERRFVVEYCVDCNAKQAAIRAGYSEHTAKQIGYENLTKPYLRAAINARLEQLSMSAAETTKRISDIAKSSLNDYFVVKASVHNPKVQKPIPEVIQDLETRMAIEEEYAQVVKLTDKEKDRHSAEQEGRKREIIRLNILLKHNPAATMIVNGEPQLVQVAELDLARLVQDKEAGKIKSVSSTEHGTKVELFAADTALFNLARMHGLYEKDNEQAKPQISNTIQFSLKRRIPDTPEQP